jgi:predicted transcriptional regulator
MTENVHELADYGLIDLKDEGRAKRPTVWYDEFEFFGDDHCTALLPAMMRQLRRNLRSCT